MNQDQMVGQKLVMDAVLRDIKVIGEAAKNIPDDVRAKMPSIEWKQITGIGLPHDWRALKLRV